MSLPILNIYLKRKWRFDCQIKGIHLSNGFRKTIPYKYKRKNQTQSVV